MLKDKVVEAITKLLMKENLAKLQAKLINKIIVICDGSHLKKINMSLLFEVLLAMKVVDLLNITARPT